MLDEVSLEEVESQESLQKELDKFRRLSSAVLGYMDNKDQVEVNLHNFAKYILTTGNRNEKRALVSCIRQQIYLENGELTIRI